MTLSERLNDDLTREECLIYTYAPAAAVALHQYPPQPPYPDPSLFAHFSQNVLPPPVVIPQHGSEDVRMTSTTKTTASISGGEIRSVMGSRPGNKGYLTRTTGKKRSARRGPETTVAKQMAEGSKIIRE